MLTAAVTLHRAVHDVGRHRVRAGTRRSIVGLIAASVVLLVVLFAVERTAAEPIVPVHLFSDAHVQRRRLRRASSSAWRCSGAISFIPLFLQVVNGASATNSGLLLLPLMLGLLAASVGSGQVITRTGRYKVFPVVGMRARRGGDVPALDDGTRATSQVTVIAYMVMLGAGIGLTMQTLVLATQNVVPTADLGAATSSVSFFRSMGGSIGVALFGALFNTGLAAHLADIDVSVGDAAQRSPRTCWTPSPLPSAPMSSASSPTRSVRCSSTPRLSSLSPSRCRGCSARRRCARLATPMSTSPRRPPRPTRQHSPRSTDGSRRPTRAGACRYGVSSTATCRPSSNDWMHAWARSSARRPARAWIGGSSERRNTFTISSRCSSNMWSKLRSRSLK